MSVGRGTGIQSWGPSSVNVLQIINHIASSSRQPNDSTDISQAHRHRSLRKDEAATLYKPEVGSLM